MSLYEKDIDRGCQRTGAEGNIWSLASGGNIIIEKIAW